MRRRAANSIAIAPRSYVITSIPAGGAILTTTFEPSRRRIRYATLNQPCPSSLTQSLPSTGTWSDP